MISKEMSPTFYDVYMYVYMHQRADSLKETFSICQDLGMSIRINNNNNSKKQFQDNVNTHFRKYILTRDVNCLRVVFVCVPNK